MYGPWRIIETDLAHGHLSLDASGWFDCVPFANQGGAVDGFNYTIQDAMNQTAQAQVTIDISATTGPQASDDKFSTYATRQVFGNVLDNDTDATDDALSVEPFNDDLAGGHLALAADGTFSYMPSGPASDSFVYTVHNSRGAAAEGTLSTTALTFSPTAARQVGEPDALGVQFGESCLAMAASRCGVAALMVIDFRDGGLDQDPRRPPSQRFRANHGIGRGPDLADRQFGDLFPPTARGPEPRINA